jgi:hypothetical protein
MGDHMNEKQQWFFLRLLALWLLLGIAAPIVAFCLTRNPLAFTGCLDLAPPAYLFTLLAKRLWPPNDNETQIAIAKHQSKVPP